MAGSTRDDASLRFTVTGEEGDTVLAQSVALTKTSSNATLPYTLKTDTMKEGRYTLVIDFISSGNNYVGSMKDIAFKKPRTLKPGDEVELVNPEFDDGINGWTKTLINFGPTKQTFFGNSFLTATMRNNGTHSLTQTVGGLPDGIYLLQACAYDEYESADDDLSQLSLFLNDNVVRLKDVYSDAVGYRNFYRYYNGQSVYNGYRHTADGRWAPGTGDWNRGVAMANHLYDNCVVATVTGGQATFGWRYVNVDNRSTNIVFDHFRLTYLTDDISRQYDVAALRTQLLRDRLAAVKQQLQTELAAKRPHAPQAVAEANSILATDEHGLTRSERILATDGHGLTRSERILATDEHGLTRNADIIDAILHAEHTVERLQLPFYEMTGEGLADIQPTDTIALKLNGTLNDNDFAALKTLKNLTELDLSDATITEIPANQFEKCQQLTWVTLPKELRIIDGSAFDGCPKLMAVTLPATLKGIGPFAFRDCYWLHSADIPDITTMGNEAYRGSGLRTLTMPATLTEVPGGLCYFCPDLNDVRLNGQTQINSYAFQGCTALTALHLPEGLRTFGFDCFRGCTGLTSVTLPSSTIFTFHSFSNCSNLKEVTCLAIAAPYNNSSSLHGDMTSRGCTLYVPRQSVESYQGDEKWAQFDIVGIDTQPATLSIVSSITLDVTDPQPAGYKPDVTLSAFCDYWAFHVRSMTSRGTLTVNGPETLSTGHLTMTYNPYAFRSMGDGRNSGATYNSIVNNGHLRADDITVNLRLYSGCWEFISFPFDVRVGDIRKHIADISLADYDTDYVPLAIYGYDGEKRAGGLFDEAWVEMTADSTLHAGQGYIWRTSAMGRHTPYGGGMEGEDANFNIFNVDALQNANKPKFFRNSDVEVTLQKHYSEFPQNRSWNLIGNPYPCYFDISAIETTAPITVWSYTNSQSSRYLAVSPLDDDLILCPGQAFFIQCPLDNDRLIFHREGRQHDNIPHYDASRRTTRATDPSRQVYNLVLTAEAPLSSPEGDTNVQQSNEAPSGAVGGASASTFDRARFVINEAASLDYEQARDAAKFAPLDADAAQLYTVRDGVRYAIDERPLADGLIRLGLSVPADGTYTLALSAPSGFAAGTITLIDLETNTEVPLGGDRGAYTFQAEAGTTEARFLIRLSNGATGVTEIENRKSENRKYFDLQGRPVANPRPGIYIQNNKKVIIK